jgi:hypothetical protein
MAALSIQVPYPVFYDRDGQPLENGNIYIGVANLDPVTNPLQVYYDEALTITASQPLVTSSGYVYRNGTPTQLYVNATDFSITVNDSKDLFVYNFPQATGIIAYTGAQTVEYDPPFTGALTSGYTVADKLSQIVSVKDFGAVGDGVTDDTAAIQAAIDYCTNLANRQQTLYFPATDAADYYKITAPLVISGRLNIVGDGQFSTTIQAIGFTAGQYILDFDNDASDVVYFGGVSQITLRSNNNLANGVRLRNSSYWTFKGVHLQALAVGIYITGTACFSNFFEQVVGYQITFYTIQWDNFTGGGQYQFLGCTFTGTDGVYLSNSAATDALAFYDCNWEQCTVTDMTIYGSVNGLTISGCRSEGLDGAASFFIRPDTGEAVRGLSVTGCTWATDAGNAYAVSLGGGSGVIEGFSITGNNAGYIGFLGFVRLNGGGDSGVISGNYCANAPVVVNGALRDGVVIYSNRNSSGQLPEYWGTADWGVDEGVWTPTDVSGAGLSFTVGVAQYTKIGRTVNLQCQITFPVTANTSDIRIGGLPYPIGASVCVTGPIDSNKGGTSAIAVIRSSTSSTGVFFTNASTSAYWKNSDFSNIVVSFSLTYTI